MAPMQFTTKSGQTVTLERGTGLASLIVMGMAGVPLNTFIDIGCADGQTALQALLYINPNASIINVDAQTTYVDSLEAVKSALGGHYKTCAAYSANCTLKFNVSPESSYWANIDLDGSNRAGVNLPSQGVQSLEIAGRTIDSLCDEFGTAPPYMIKMDIEGGEFNALQGAEKTLEKTSALLLETNFYYGKHSGGKFGDIVHFLTSRGFSLFDVTDIAYGHRGAILTQVYTAFIRNEYDFRGNLQDELDSARLAPLLGHRRTTIRQSNVEFIDAIKSLRG